MEWQKAVVRAHSNKIYVQYGCGMEAPVQWLNFDSSPTLRFERIPIIGRLYTRNTDRFPSNVRCGDIVKGLPVKNDSVDGLYASHVLEHLSLQDFRIAIHNSYRILKRGGIFRLVVPDLKARADSYLLRLQNGDPFSSHAFMESTGLGRNKTEKGFRRIIHVFGNSSHLWMWDEQSLSAELIEAGFCDVRRCAMGDCTDTMFALVEKESRFVVGGISELAIEARK